MGTLPCNLNPWTLPSHHLRNTIAQHVNGILHRNTRSATLDRATMCARLSGEMSQMIPQWFTPLNPRCQCHPPVEVCAAGVNAIGDPIMPLPVGISFFELKPWGKVPRWLYIKKEWKGYSKTYRERIDDKTKF